MGYIVFFFFLMMILGYIKRGRKDAPPRAHLIPPTEKPASLTESQWKSFCHRTKKFTIELQGWDGKDATLKKRKDELFKALDKDLFQGLALTDEEKASIISKTTLSLDE